MRDSLRLVGAALAAAAAMTAPASAAGLLSYGVASADATVKEDGRTFKLYVHPKEPLLLIQTSMGAAWTQHPNKWPDEVWRHAAQTLVAPAGCTITDLQAKSRMGATWEATFACPAGVDLRALMTAQRAALTHGEPLQPSPAALAASAAPGPQAAAPAAIATP